VSANLLSNLLETNVFLPSAITHDLIACHVPFDDLVPGTEVEKGLEERTLRSVAVALIGKTGCGKSGASAYVFSRLGTEFAPIYVPVFYETEETIRDPGTFARYLLHKLLAAAEGIAAVSREERERLLVQASERLTTPTHSLGHSGGVGVNVWLLKGDVARDVSETIHGSNYAGSTDAALGAIDEVVDAIRTSGMVPLILIDDTDRWLQVGDIDRSPLVAAFFGTIVRMLAERGCGLVVAVHDSYLEMPTYRSGTEGFLTDSVVIPHLTSEDQLSEILDRRISFSGTDASRADVLDGDAIERLFHYYEGVWNHSLRKTLQALHIGLSNAAATEQPLITLSGIDDAAAGLS
jgi:hypothetical protein